MCVPIALQTVCELSCESLGFCYLSANIGAHALGLYALSTDIGAARLARHSRSWLVRI